MVRKGMVELEKAEVGMSRKGDTNATSENVTLHLESIAAVAGRLSKSGAVQWNESQKERSKLGRPGHFGGAKRRERSVGWPGTDAIGRVNQVPLADESSGQRRLLTGTNPDAVGRRAVRIAAAMAQEQTTSRRGEMKVRVKVTRWRPKQSKGPSAGVDGGRCDDKMRNPKIVPCCNGGGKPSGALNASEL